MSEFRNWHSERALARIARLHSERDQAGSGAGALGEQADRPREPRASDLAASAPLLPLSRGLGLCAAVPVRTRRHQDHDLAGGGAAARAGSGGTRQGEARSAEPFPRYMQIKRGKQGGPDGKAPP